MLGGAWQQDAGKLPGKFWVLLAPKQVMEREGLKLTFANFPSVGSGSGAVLPGSKAPPKNLFLLPFNSLAKLFSI